MLARLSRAFARHRRRRALQAELAGLAPADQEVIFRDVGLSREEMARVIDGSLDETLLERMLRRVGIDPQTLARTDPWTARDLQRVCGQCMEWGRCTAEFDAGTMASGVPAYCPNHSAIGELAKAIETQARPAA
jgi:hypothetical protein